MAGDPIETLEGAFQWVKDQVMTDLIRLALRELFEFGVMQTGPNFANYLYQPQTDKIVLLDFGAARTIAPHIVDQYRHLLCAGLEDDVGGLTTVAQNMGLFDADTRDEHRMRIVQMLRQVFHMIREGGAIDFADQTLANQLQAEGLALFQDGFSPSVLPIDVLLIQRKFAGLFLLGARLGACVNVGEIFRRHGGHLSAGQTASFQ